MARIRTRIFQSWFRLSRPMTLGVRAVVENEAGEVFLIRHTYTPGWYLPGGGVEKAETSLYSLERELLEEGGFTLTSPPDLVGIYSNHFVFPNDHVVLYRAIPAPGRRARRHRAGKSRKPPGSIRWPHRTTRRPAHARGCGSCSPMPPAPPTGRCP